MNNIEINDKGFIALNDKVMVSDPCYEMNTWCQGVIDNVLKGNYKCTVETSDEGTWIITSAIRVVRVLDEKERQGILQKNGYDEVAAYAKYKAAFEKRMAS